MEDILKDLSNGRIDVDQALEELEKRLYGAPFSNIDPHRDVRTGVPEVILAEGKTLPQIISITRDFLERTGRAIISRIESDDSRRLEEEFGNDDTDILHEPTARFLVLRRKDRSIPKTDGMVGILTAGTSDVGVAREAELMAREMGCSVRSFHDVGVAGVHRLMMPLRDLENWGASVIVVAAGREGALPTLVSGLTRIPVIGLPVSTGYGMHGKGETALFAMLQSCSPLAVVNIDAGFVAGAMAGKIANTVSGQ